MAAEETNSAAIKSMVMRAWRERWSEEQWSARIKNELPKGSHAVERTCYLTDVLMDQALVGSTPNALLLSYLKHAINTQVCAQMSLSTAILFVSCCQLNCVTLIITRSNFKL